MEEVGEKSDQIANIREKIDDIQSIRPEEGIVIFMVKYLKLKV